MAGGNATEPRAQGCTTRGSSPQGDSHLPRGETLPSSQRNRSQSPPASRSHGHLRPRSRPLQRRGRNRGRARPRHRDRRADRRSVLPSTRPFGSGFELDANILDTPRRVTIISREQLAAISIQDARDFSKLTSSSFTQTNFGAPANPSIRGQSADVFVNGIRDAADCGHPLPPASRSACCPPKTEGEFLPFPVPEALRSRVTPPRLQLRTAHYLLKISVR